MKEELIFAGILLLSQASPGPDQAFVTRSTLAYGFGAGVMAALGIGTGIVVHAALACTVGASVFTVSWGWGCFAPLLAGCCIWHGKYGRGGGMLSLPGAAIFPRLPVFTVMLW